MDINHNKDIIILPLRWWEGDGAADADVLFTLINLIVIIYNKIQKS
jgi:hypothetical protein